MTNDNNSLNSIIGAEEPAEYLENIGKEGDMLNAHKSAEDVFGKYVIESNRRLI